MQYLPHGDRAKEEATREGQQQSYSINSCVWAHRQIDGILWKWLPRD